MSEITCGNRSDHPAAHNDARKLLLSRFLRGSNPDRGFGEYWDGPLGASIQTVIQEFKSAELIVPAPVSESLQVALSADQLKNLMREHSLPVSGKKAVLVARYVDANPAAAQTMASERNIWICSEVAARLASAFIADRDATEKAAIDKMSCALKMGRIEEAVAVVVCYEQQQVFPRGLGMDWSRPETTTRLEEDLRAIFSAQPVPLEGLEPSALNELKVAAGLLHLTGESRAERWLPSSLKSHRGLPPDRLLRSLQRAVHAERRLKQIRGVYARLIIHGSEECCDNCAVLHGQEFESESAPMLPFPACVAQMCVCEYHAVIKSNKLLRTHDVRSRVQ